MPLEVRPIAISIAVIFFFGFSIIGIVNGLEPGTCCKRAVIGAFSAYIVASLAVKAINAIAMESLINKQMQKMKEESNSSGNTN